MHAGDVGNGNLLRTNRLAGTGERAGAKAFRVHLVNHADNTFVAFWLTLWQ